MKHTLPAALLGLGALAAAGLAALPHRPVVARGHLAPRAHAPTRAEPTRRYAVELATSLSLRGDGADSLDVRVTGALEVRALGADGDVERLALRLVSPRASVTQAGRDALTPATRAQTEAALATDVFVDRAPDGSLRDARLAEGLDPLVAGCLRYLAATLQFTRGEGARWTAREVDAAGACAADYQRTGARSFERTRRDWARPADGARVGVEGRAVARITLSADGEVERVVTDDRLSTRASEGVTAASASRATLQRASGSGLDEAERARLLLARAARRPVRLDEATADATTRAAADRRVVAGATVSSLRAMLPDDASTEEGGARAAEVHARLAALLRTDARAAAEARAALAVARPSEVDALTAALSSVGDVACQRALADAALDAALPSEARVAAVTSLGLVDRPTEASVRALARASEEAPLHGRATMALGAAGGASQAAGAEGAGLAFELLARRLEGATTTDERVLVLDAIGNTGDPRAVPLAEGLASHPEAAVREAAVAAVRLVRAPEADALVSSRLRGRDDAAARVGALRAASFRPLEPLASGLEAVLSAETAQGLRARAVSMLGGRVRQSAMAAELLLRVAEGDPDADVRSTAREFLRQLDGA